MIGTVKDEFSQEIVDELENRIEEEKIEGVEMVINQSFGKIREIFAKASIGLHMMIDEHFGISIVEMLVNTVP